MVQRLSLHGVVSKEELPIALHSLEAISGMKHRQLSYRRGVWEPAHRFVPSSAQATQTEQYRLFVISRDDSVTIQAQEIPEAGRNIKVISQSVDSSIIKEGDARKFMSTLGYSLKSECEVRGKEFVLYTNLVVQLFQLFANDELLDPSGQYIVQAHVDVESVTDLHAVEQATQLLLSVQQELRGVVSLKVPARNAFNTRMPRMALQA